LAARISLRSSRSTDALKRIPSIAQPSKGAATGQGVLKIKDPEEKTSCLASKESRRCEYSRHAQG